MSRLFPIAVIQWITFVYSTEKPTENNFRPATAGPGVLPVMTGTFFSGFRYSDEERIETAVFTAREGQSINSVCKKCSNEADAFYGCYQVEKKFWFCDLFIFTVNYSG